MEAFALSDNPRSSRLDVVRSSTRTYAPAMPMGDPKVPIELADTPRMRRLTAIWVNELRRQWGLAGE
jgi:hypothetical protein